MKINKKIFGVKIIPSDGLSGVVNTPSDKSISHRAIILGALCIGETKIHNLLMSEDISCTIAAVEQFGAKVLLDDNSKIIKIYGIGIGGLFQPKKEIDCGNSGTSTRLLMGLISSIAIEATFKGDKSLSQRPMQRVLEPLQSIGIEIKDGNGINLPLKVRGSSYPLPIKHELSIASAQVKSALMFAALNIKGKSIIIEPVKTRDHTERLFEIFGANINLYHDENDKKVIEIIGENKLMPQEIDIPGDPSSAAFFIVAGLVTPGSFIKINNVMLNPTRSLYIDYLIQMGANIKFVNKFKKCGEVVCDLEVKTSKLKGMSFPSDVSPSLIDEYLILSVAAAFAEGETIFYGLSELRVKESDRFDAIINLLTMSGVKCKSDGDDLIIYGERLVKGGGKIESNLDHRVVMSAMIMGMATEQPIIIDNLEPISTSFPDFLRFYKEIGGKYQKN
tara:strand:+ start:11741 stop:13084 length:1344 start_codon:yes stop_codon:yes gene_type:complete